MKPLIVLIATFLIALVVLKVLRQHWELMLSARIAMSVMLIFTTVGHFAFTEGMTMMIPDFVPFKKEMVCLTAVIEIMAAIGLHVPQLKVVTAWLLIFFFVLVLPANIKAAIENIDYQTGTYSGKGLSYLWLRIPLQLLFITWVYFSSLTK